jgi:2,6-dihydroxypyridine 3-monooxygenase
VSEWPRVAVVGGSLGGLTAALVLRDLGCQVDVFERSIAELESRGAGIVVLDETVRYFRERTDLELEQLTTATGLLRYLGRGGAVVYEERRRYRYSAWHTIYRALLDCFERGRYHLGKEMSGFSQQDDHVQVRFADGSAAAYDLLVCADGISSNARTMLQPQARPAYAGYVAWRGTVDERQLSRGVRDLLADSISYQVMPNSHILLYPIPALDGSVALGRRLANFVWYRNYGAGEELDDLMTDRDGVRRDITPASGCGPPGASGGATGRCRSPACSPVGRDRAGQQAPVRPGDLRHRGRPDGLRTRLPDRRRRLRRAAARRRGNRQGGRRRLGARRGPRSHPG